MSIRTATPKSRIIFYYDVVCPFAYMTSTLVEDLARRAGATVHWSPVLLGKSSQHLTTAFILGSCLCPLMVGGLYEATSAVQGRGGSATMVMSSNKVTLYTQGL